jgi:hypothetical protein
MPKSPDSAGSIMATAPMKISPVAPSSGHCHGNWGWRA